MVCLDTVCLDISFLHEHGIISSIFRQVPVLLKMGNSRILEFSSH